MFAINHEPHLQIQLARAIDNMDMQQARKLIVDLNVIPQIGLHGLEERSLFFLIQNAAALHDELLLRRLSYYHNSLSAKVLWSTLDNIKMATILIRSRVNHNLRRDDRLKPTLLHVLSESNDPRKLELAELMIRRGVDVTAVDSNKRSVLQYAISGGAPQYFIQKLIEYSNERFTKNTIEIAVSHRCAELMPLLLKNGALDDSTISRRARDAIYIVLNMHEACTVEAIEILLQYHMPMDVSYVQGFTPLQKMVLRDNVEVAEVFLQRGADPNKHMKQGYTPLWVASSLEQSSMSTLLIKWGADIHLRNANGQYPIHAACKSNSISNMLLLNCLGGDFNVIDNRGTTPLMLLSEQDSPNKNAQYAFVIRHLAHVAFKGSEINSNDLRLIRSHQMQDLYDTSFHELKLMERMEVAGDIPYYTFLNENVSRTSRLTRRYDIEMAFENEARLRQLFPHNFCDLRNAYIFARERENIVLKKEEELSAIFYEMLQILLPYLIINKIVSYICIDDLKNFIPDFHTLSNMIWE